MPITSRDGTASSTELSSIATTDSATVSSEMIAIGRPYCTARLMVPTSRVTRVTRSPVLALSTWPSGSRRMVRTMYSRADASRSCPKSVEVRWAKKVKSACMITTPTTSSATRSRPAPFAVDRAVDEVAQQPRDDERGGRSEAVEHHEGHEGTAALGDEGSGEAEDRAVAGDRPAPLGMPRRLVDAVGLLAPEVVSHPPGREALGRRRVDRGPEPRVDGGSVVAVVRPGGGRGVEQVGGHVATSSSITRATTAR